MRFWSHRKIRPPKSRCWGCGAQLKNVKKRQKVRCEFDCVRRVTERAIGAGIWFDTAGVAHEIGSNPEWASTLMSSGKFDTIDAPDLAGTLLTTRRSIMDWLVNQPNKFAMRPKRAPRVPERNYVAHFRVLEPFLPKERQNARIYGWLRTKEKP